MRARRLAACVVASAAAFAGTLCAEQAARAADPPVAAGITGDSTAPGIPIRKRLFGICFEDINHAADGGLYPELVQNRSFEFNSIDNPSYTGLTAWSLDNRGGAAGSVAVATDAPLNDENLNYLRLTIDAPGAGVAIRNSGFNTGLYVEAGKRYKFSFWARRDGTADLPVRVRVERPARPSTRRRAPRSTRARGRSTAAC